MEHHNANHQDTILLVDDSPEDLRTLEAILTEKGYPVISCDNGMEALKMVGEHYLDLILLNVTMQEMSGYQVCQQIKADEATDDIPIIFISALDDVKYKVKALSVGGIDYITKPVHIDELLIRIHVHLKTAKKQRQLISQNLIIKEIVIEQERFEEALLISEQNYRELVETANSIIVRWTSNGYILFMNRFGLEFFGYTKKDVLNKSMIGTIISEENHIIQRTLFFLTRNILKNPHEYENMELENVKKDGSSVYVLWTNKAITDEDNNIKEILSMGIDISEKKAMETKLNEMASIDVLTNIYNRRYFMELFEKEINRYNRYGNTFSVMILDIDHFKSINDVYGHDIGDKVLQAFTESGKEVIRNIDVFGRVGGEEFAVLLPVTDLPSALIAAERFRTKIEQTKIPVHDEEISITVSIGIASVTQKKPDKEILLKQADEALYVAKKNGRNRIETFQVTVS